MQQSPPNACVGSTTSVYNATFILSAKILNIVHPVQNLHKQSANLIFEIEGEEEECGKVEVCVWWYEQGEGGRVEVCG